MVKTVVHSIVLTVIRSLRTEVLCVVIYLAVMISELSQCRKVHTNKPSQLKPVCEGMYFLLLAAIE